MSDWDWEDDQVGLLLDERGAPLKKVYKEKLPYGFAPPQKDDE